jgi:Spy/CpxP family protein refolding chaperone
MIKTTLAAALISLSTLASVPAQASDISIQIGFGGGPGWSDNGHGHQMRRQRLSTDEVRWILRDHGYRQIRFFDNRGPVYQLRARKHGDTFFLVVSARSGEILSRHRF